MYNRDTLLKNLSEVRYTIGIAEREATLAEAHGDQDYACTMRSVMESAIGRRKEMERALSMLPS